MNWPELFKAIEDALPDLKLIEAVGEWYDDERGEERMTPTVWYSGGNEKRARDEVRARIGLPLAEDVAKVSFQGVVGPFLGTGSPEPGGSISLVSQTGPLARGTLGCFVSLSSADQGPYLLTAEHIVFGGRIGDPFMLDCGPQPCRIGTLHQTGNLVLDDPAIRNRADCALGKVTTAVSSYQPARNVVFSGALVLDPAQVRKRQVAMVGAVSEFQVGKFSAYPVSLKVTFEILNEAGENRKGYFDGQAFVKGSGFGAFGDSGSLVVVADDPKKEGHPKKGDAVGILFAGDTTTTAGSGPMDLFVVSPMPGVRDQLKLNDLSIKTKK
jgi:hypothetical protein